MMAERNWMTLSDIASCNHASERVFGIQLQDPKFIFSEMRKSVEGKKAQSVTFDSEVLF